MSYLQSPSRFRHLMRKWGKPVLFVTSGLAVAASPFLLDYYIHTSLEDYASRVNGAQVTIREFDLSWLHGTCRLGGIQVAHHTQPMRNLVELDEVTVTFDRGALLGFKLIVPTVHVEGVHYGTARERSGVLVQEEYDALPSTALLDRIVPGVYDSVKAGMDETPLRNLGQLTVGIAMRNSVAPYQQQLGVFQRIKSVDLELDHLLSQWEQENERISQGGTAEDRANRFSMLRAKVKTEAENLTQRAEHSFDAAPRDTDFILAKLGIPPLVDDDLTREVLGRRTLNHLERIAYWIEMSRRKMGLDSQMGTAAAPRQAAAGGPPAVSSPRILVRKITIHSVAGNDRHKGNVQAQITDLASRPLGADHPLVIDFAADFPGLQIRGLKLHVTMDHSAAQPKEVIDFKLDSYPLVDWAVEQTTDLSLAVASGTMGITFQSEFEGASQAGRWTVLLRNAQFEVQSRFGLMERTLKEVLTPFSPLITVQGSLAGTNGKVEFDVRSNAGRELATVLNQRFGPALHSARATVNEEIQDRFVPQLKRLQARIQNSTSRFDRRLVDAIDLLGLKPG